MRAYKHLYLWMDHLVSKWIGKDQNRSKFFRNEPNLIWFRNELNWTSFRIFKTHKQTKLSLDPTTHNWLSFVGTFNELEMCFSSPAFVLHLKSIFSLEHANKAQKAF